MLMQYEAEAQFPRTRGLKAYPVTKEHNATPGLEEYEELQRGNGTKPGVTAERREVTSLKE